MPNATLDAFDFRASTPSWEGPDPSDLAWRVFLAWHDVTQRVFVAVERIDDVFLDDDAWEFISFMVDGDHSGGQFQWYSEPGRELTEAEIRQNGVQAQLYGPGIRRHEGRRMAIWTTAAWASDPPWTEVGAGVLSEEPHDFILEFAITPWDNLSGDDGPEFSERSLLEPDGIIGFQMLMSDSDVPNVPKGQYTIAPATMNELAHYADNFVDGMLIPCDTGDCSGTRGTVVREDSWGRIKAAFR